MSKAEQIKRSPLRRLTGFIRLLILLVLFGIIAGFGVFALVVSGSEPPEQIDKADGIVVLTGPGGGRLESGAKLLKYGHAERLLISGVDKSVTSEKLITLLGLDQELFDCCVDIDREADSTVANARETASWARAQGYEHLIIVTSDYHMPRSLFELRQALDEDIRLTPYPVSVSKAAQDASGESRFTSLSREYAKLLVIYARNMGARSDAAPLQVPAPESDKEK